MEVDACLKNILDHIVLIMQPVTGLGDKLELRIMHLSMYCPTPPPLGLYGAIVGI